VKIFEKCSDYLLASSSSANKEFNILTDIAETNDFNEVLLETNNIVEPIIHNHISALTTSNKKDKLTKIKPKTK
jgi:hypothetical protein